MPKTTKISYSDKCSYAINCMYVKWLKKKSITPKDKNGPKIAKNEN